MPKIAAVFALIGCHSVKPIAGAHVRVGARECAQQPSECFFLWHAPTGLACVAPAVVFGSNRTVPDAQSLTRMLPRGWGPQQDDQIVFVFNKACFKQGAGAGSTDEREIVVRAELPTQEQSLSSSSNLGLKAMQDGSLDHHDEPMHKALLESLSRFLHWNSTAEAYLTAGRTRVSRCREVQGQVRMQRRASALALTSLQRYYASVAQALDKVDDEVAQISDLVATSLSHAKVLSWGAFHPPEHAQGMRAGADARCCLGPKRLLPSALRVPFRLLCLVFVARQSADARKCVCV